MTRRDQIRKNVEALRQRRKEAGLVRVEVWVKPEDSEKIRAFAKSLSQKGHNE